MAGRWPADAIAPAAGGPGADVLVGIAIPAYDAVSTLEQTLRSCVRQTHRRWVARVTVDGGSADAEAALAAALGDARIQVVANGSRLGQFGNFNRAIESCADAGATWIKLLCADDVLHDDALARLVAVGESDPGCGLVYGFFNGIGARGEPLFETIASEIRDQVLDGRSFQRATLRSSLFNIIGGPSSAMIRADVLKRLGGFDESFSYAGDVELWHRLLGEVKIGVVGGAPILDYRYHENSVTGRGRMSVAAFREPLEIACAIAARTRPFRPDWWLVQWIRGEIAASNAVTALALARRGEFAASARGLRATLSRTGPLAALLALMHFPNKLVRLAIGARVPRHPLIPRVRLPSAQPARRTS